MWNEANFKEYIKDPRAKIPGTKMIFPGIKNDQEVNNLWAYLKQFGPRREEEVNVRHAIWRLGRAWHASGI